MEKKGYKNIDIEKLLENTITISMENFDKLPKEIQESMHLFTDDDKTIYFPEKYFAAQKFLIQGKLNKIYKSNPENPLKDVVAIIIGALPDFIEAKDILDLTKFTIENWQQLQKKPALIPV